MAFSIFVEITTHFFSSNPNFKTSYGNIGGLGGPGIPGSFGSNHSQSFPQPSGGILWPSLHSWVLSSR